MAILPLMGGRAGGGSRQRATMSILFLVLSFLLTITMKLSLLSDTSGLRALVRKFTGETLQDGKTMLYHVPTFYEDQAQAAHRRLDDVLRNPVLQDAFSKEVPGDAFKDVCPMILSVVSRPKSPWLITLSSIFKDIEDNRAVRVRIPTVLRQRGGGGLFDELLAPFTVPFVQQLVDKGLMRPVTIPDWRNFPNDDAFRAANLSSKSWIELRRLAGLAFAYAYALEDCHAQKCELCMILHDDMLLSFGWRGRISGVQELNWGVLKLMRAEISFRNDYLLIEGWSIEHVSLIGLLGVISGTVILCIAIFATADDSFDFWDLNLLPAWIICVIYGTILVALLGHDFFFQQTASHLDLSSRPTRMLQDEARIYGASIFRSFAFRELANAVRNVATAAIDPSLLPSDEAQIETALSILRSLPSNSDRVKAEVIAVKYLTNIPIPVVLIDPAVAQHIGFLPSEEEVPRTLFWTDRFEDGRVI